jgi:arsenite methyltransferase
MKFTFRYGIDAPFWVALNMLIGAALSITSIFGLPQSIFGLLRLAQTHTGDEVLDVGTGRGLLAIAAAQCGCKVTVVDKWSQWDLGGNGREALIKCSG